jgi:hypothetical protein
VEDNIHAKFDDLDKVPKMNMFHRHDFFKENNYGKWEEMITMLNLDKKQFSLH